MSRFWGGSSSESTESDYSSSSGSSDEYGVGEFANKYAYSSSSGDEVRVVRSHKDKQLDFIREQHSKLSSALEDNDWENVLSEYETLMKQEKTIKKKVGELPPSFYRCLVLCDDSVLATKPKQLKACDGRAKRAFNAMKQRMRKLKMHKPGMKAYRENPIVSDEGESSDEKSNDDAGDMLLDVSSGSDDDDGEPTERKTRRGFWTKSAGSSSSSDSGSDDFGSDDDSDGSDDNKGKRKRSQKKKVRVKKAVKQIKWTKDLVDERFKILQQGGKRNRAKLSRKEIINKLVFLLTKAKTPDQRLKMVTMMTAVYFDSHKGMDQVMPSKRWEKCLFNVVRIIKMFEQHPDIPLSTLEQASIVSGGQSSVASENSGLERIMAFTERLGDELKKSFQVHDLHSRDYLIALHNEERYLSLCLFVKKFYEGFVRSKAAQQSDNADALDVDSVLARIGYRLMNAIYYRRDSYVPAKIDITPPPIAKPPIQNNLSILSNDNGDAKATSTTGQPSTDDTKATTSTAPVQDQVTKSDPTLVYNADPKQPPQYSQLLHQHAKSVYKAGSRELRSRALLMEVYHHAVEDRFHQGRDLMLMSHLQQTIHNADVETQIYFNRAMVQLGLSAFRNGLIKEANASLGELFNGSRSNKELLAQGVSSSRYSERDPSQLKVEKFRLVPDHKHINGELIECVHLMTAMLHEVPSVAANPFAVKRKSLSRPFRRLMDYFDRQLFIGPPESSRDYIFAATKALTSSGDWQTCYSYLLKLSCWKFMHPKTEQVQRMVLRKVKETALRTYIFTYVRYYDSFSLQNLSLMFQLSQPVVKGILSKMMVDEELHASWDQPTNSIIVHQLEPTRLQSLALQFSDKLSNLVDYNERTHDQQSGSSGYKFGGRQTNAKKSSKKSNQNRRQSNNNKKSRH
mmetsp:Transcript_12641/g.19100  ORF Transcript_12641/g.19100 Transcript_12641/m.19100 type:complete len:909 (+) Transcript_12641:39-2765(+)